MIYFVVGHKGVGKTFLFNKMKRDGNFCAYDTGPIVRYFYKKDRCVSDLSFAEWVSFCEKKWGENVFPQRIVDYILSHNKKDKITVIFGNRKLSAIKEMARMLKDDFLIVYIDAPNKLLKQNFENREDVVISARDWLKMMRDEDKYGLKEIKDYVLKNSDKNFFYTKCCNNPFLSVNIMCQLKLCTHKLAFPKFLYYTTNSGKKVEAIQVLKKIYQLDFDFPANPIPAPEIQASTCADVAAFTAKYLADKLNVNILKSDSGLYIDCLGGLPGPYSADFAKQLGEEKLLKLLKKEKNRKATIEHCFAYCEPNSDPVVFCGKYPGRISKHLGKAGVWLERFFVPKKFNKTLGELIVIDHEKEIECWGNAINQFAIWYLQNKGKNV